MQHSVVDEKADAKELSPPLSNSHHFRSEDLREQEPKWPSNYKNLSAGDVLNDLNGVDFEDNDAQSYSLTSPS